MYTVNRIEFGTKAWIAVDMQNRRRGRDDGAHSRRGEHHHLRRQMGISRWTS